MSLGPKPTEQDGQGVHQGGGVHGLDGGSHHANHVLLAQGPNPESLVEIGPMRAEKLEVEDTVLDGRTDGRGTDKRTRSSIIII